MKLARLIFSAAILAAASGAYAAGDADNAWLMLTPVPSGTPAPASASGDTSTVDALNMAVEP